MAFSLPNPTSPTNGQSLDATPILANEIAIAQAIASFDGSQVQAGTIVGSALATTANPNTLLAATTFPFVASGCVWSAVSGLGGTMTGGIIYYNGTPVTVNSVASHTFTASDDTYVDIDKNGNVTYNAVSNNSASPAITTNSIRVAIVVCSGSAITTVNLGSIAATAPTISSVLITVQDSLGNLIYPTNPDMSLLGFRKITGNFVLSSSQTTPTQVTGLSCPVIIPAGRNVKMEFYCAGVTLAGGIGVLTLWDGTVNSGTQVGQGNVATSTNEGNAKAFVTPGATPKTYNAGVNNTGSNNTTIGAASTQPAYIAVELE